MNPKDAVESLAALAQETRLAIFRLLVKRGPEGYAPGVLGERLKIPGPTLSFHLKALAQADLLVSRKESRFIYYSANFERMNDLVGFLTDNCCSLGSDCGTNCASTSTKTRRKSA